MPRRSGEALNASTVQIAARDGVPLNLRVYLPSDGPSRLPAIVWFTPYAHPGNAPDFVEGESVTGVSQCLISFFALHGYAVVVADMRGNGASGGCPDSGGPLDQQDGATVVDWVAGQPWSDGLVGARGWSDEGRGAYSAAIADPPALKAIVALSPSNLYDVTYYGGVRFDQAPYNLATWQSPGESADNVPGRATSSGCVPESQQANVEVNGTDDGTMTKYYQDRDLPTLATPIHAAVLQTVGATNYGADGDTTWEFPRFWRALDQAGVPRKGYVGPWKHGLPALPGTSPTSDPGTNPWLWIELRWFEHWLKDNDTGMMREPAITVLDGTTNTAATWPDYPPPSQNLELEPGGGVLAARVASGSASYTDVPGLTRELVRQIAGDRVIYNGATLAQPLRLSGIGHLDVAASLDTTGTHLAAHLYDVAPDGSLTDLTWGFLDTRNRGGLATKEDVAPGERYVFSISLVPVERTVPVGHHLQLVLSSTDNCFAPELLNMGNVTSTTPAANLCDTWGVDSDTTRATVTIYEGPRQTLLTLPVVQHH